MVTFPIFPNKISNSIRTPSICLRFKGEGDWRCIACDGPMDGALCEDSRNDFFSSINKEKNKWPYLSSYSESRKSVVRGFGCCLWAWLRNACSKIISILRLHSNPRVSVTQSARLAIKDTTFRTENKDKFNIYQTWWSHFAGKTMRKRESELFNGSFINLSEFWNETV